MILKNKLKYLLNKYKDSVNNYDIKDFKESLKNNADKNSNFNDFKSTMSIFCDSIKEEWKLKKTSFYKWDSFFNKIAENNLTTLVGMTPVFKKNTSYPNLFFYFVQNDINHVSKTTLKKFVELISFEDLINPIFTVGNNKHSLLACIMNSENIDCLSYIVNKFTPEKVFDSNITIVDNFYSPQKESFLDYIISKYILKFPDFENKEGLLKIKELFLNNVDNKTLKNEESNIKNMLSMEGFLKIEEFYTLLNKNILNKEFLLQSIKYVLKNNEINNQKKEELLNYLQEENGVDVFYLSKLNTTIKIEDIEILTNTSLFEKDKIAQKIMTLYFSFFHEDKSVFNYFLAKVKNSSTLNEKEKILSYSLKLVSFNYNMLLFSNMLSNDIFKDIYNEIEDKDNFQDMIKEITFSYINKLAFLEKYLLKLKEIDFTPYEKVKYKGKETTFKESLSYIYSKNIDNVFSHLKKDRKNKRIC